MNYFGPRQRKDGRWDYTNKNDGKIWPIGYCDKYKELNRDYFQGFPDSWFEQQRQKIEPTKHKHHTDGHATAEEACTCYREYLLDHELHFGKWDQQHKCKICGEWSQVYACVGNTYYFDLCEKHESRDTVASLLTVGEVWSS